MAIPRRILVPTDFSPTSEEAFRYALGLAASFDGYVVLLHALEAHGLRPGLDSAKDAALRAAGRALTSVAEGTNRRGIPVSTILEEGTPWRVIVDAAHETDVDLIVMSTHGRGSRPERGLSRMVLGGVTEKVMRAVRCPVLTVSQGAAGSA
jgi:nucleotide-binding universal stress UspA family protein